MEQQQQQIELEQQRLIQQQEQIEQAQAQMEAARRQAAGVSTGLYGAAREAVEAGGAQNMTPKELRDALAKAPTFDEAKTLQDFRTFLTELYKWLAIYGIVTDAQFKLALIYSIKGASAM